MIDNFSILLSHALILIMLSLLLFRDDVDIEDPPIPDEDPRGFEKKPDASFKESKKLITMREQMEEKRRA